MYKVSIKFKNIPIRAGSDLGFSRGGRIFKKKNSKTLSNFFWVNQIDFPSSLKALQSFFYGQSFYAAGKILKKQVKKGVFKHFL